MYLCTRFRTNTSTGEMVEWSITVVLKTTVPRGTGGSNPSLSANFAENQQVRKLPPKLPPKMVILGGNFALTFIYRRSSRVQYHKISFLQELTYLMLGMKKPAN